MWEVLVLDCCGNAILFTKRRVYVDRGREVRVDKAVRRGISFSINYEMFEKTKKYLRKRKSIFIGK